MRWFSPGSDDSLAHWTFYCTPSEKEAPPQPWLPECVLNKDEKHYKGTQWVTNRGHPCLPWITDKETVSKTSRETALKNWNYCRNPNHENGGTYCIAITKSGKLKTKCHLRLCKSSECRLAGTGNDYIGKLSTTRSNRTCQKWIENTPHVVNPKFLNGSLFPDLNVTLAENYCRDPNHNVSGPWCYTTDVNVPFDACNVKDCSKQEECIIMTKGNGNGRQIYILPQWKERGVHGGLFFSLKEWNPDLLDGIIFQITPLEGDGWIQLIIGAEKNEKVILSYGKTRKDAIVMKEKTFPHLIPAGKWGTFWLQIRKGEIMLGYEGIAEPLFEWQHTDAEIEPFEPMFMTFMSIEGNIIGVHFKCEECQTERTEIKRFTRIMPLGIWSKEENINYSNISFYLRGTGIALIPLMLLPGSGNYYGVTIGDFGSWVFLIYQRQKVSKTLRRVNLSENALKPDKWTLYTISYTETNLQIYRDNSSILKYKSKKPMLFYWFSFGAEKGWVTWSANCPPIDLEGIPRDGGWSGWSPWTCTVSCGGGTGYRTRTCSNPRPNIFGKLCEGPTRSTGRCNDFECGDISPNTINKIRNHLKVLKFSYIIDEGTKIVLENDKVLLEIIKLESPGAYYEWSLNGVYLTEIKDRIKFIGDDIVIHEATISDTGVYTCTLYRINEKRIVFRVISLAVKPNSYSITTRETYSLTLLSRAVVLGYVYTDLTQKWIINNVIYIDYGITTLAAVSTEHISSLNVSHGGTWQCVVEQSDLKLRWVTNIVTVRIRRAPNLLTHLMEDEWSRKIFGGLNNETQVLIVLIVMLVSLIALVVFGTFAYLKWIKLPQSNRYERQKNVDE